MFANARKIIRWAGDASRSPLVFLYLVGIGLTILFWQRERAISGAVLGLYVTSSLLLTGAQKLLKYLGKRLGEISRSTAVGVGIALVATGVVMIVFIAKIPLAIPPVVFGFTLMSLGVAGVIFVIAGELFFLTLMGRTEK